MREAATTSNDDERESQERVEKKKLVLARAKQISAFEKKARKCGAFTGARKISLRLDPDHITCPLAFFIC